LETREVQDRIGKRERRSTALRFGKERNSEELRSGGKTNGEGVNASNRQIGQGANEHEYEHAEEEKKEGR
jgi:hypothetical protein